MRISDLDTRSAALGESTAYFAVDQASSNVTNKIDYNALARAIIEQYTGSTIGGAAQSVKAAVDTLNSNITIDASNKHTRIPPGSDFNSYTTPGVYYVTSDSDGATMVNAPRKASGKLIVMARHTAEYLVQYYYPSTVSFIRYVRSLTSTENSPWVREEINHYNNQNKVYYCGALSSASDKTFEELGFSIYQYGAYFVVFRGDTARDASWVGIVRHNSSGYQISEIYKGADTSTAYVDSNGIVKTDNPTGLNTMAFVQPISTWGDVL